MTSAEAGWWPRAVNVALIKDRRRGKPFVVVFEPVMRRMAFSSGRWELGFFIGFRERKRGTLCGTQLGEERTMEPAWGNRSRENLEQGGGVSSPCLVGKTPPAPT